MTPAFFDTECYPNYWLLKFRPQGGVTHTFALRGNQSFNELQQAAIRHLFDTYTTISFNGIRYDVPIIACALDGHPVEVLKRVNDKIIVEKQKHWELGLPEWEPPDHIDVMETAPGAGSQKQYAGRIHCRTMRDLPYDPNLALTEDQMAEVDAYCENDLDVLEALYNALRPQIEQRIALGERYGLDLRSKSDAQVAEAVLRKRCEQAAGHRLYKLDIDWNMSFQCQVPEFIAFDLPQLQRALDQVRQATFRLGASGAVEMPPQLEDLAITIGKTTYKMGIGGLHSQEKQLVTLSDEHNQLRMPDVASYYPSLILNSGAWPPALGPQFLSEYRIVKDDRLAAKAEQKRLDKLGDTSSPTYQEAHVGNEGGKIMLNGTFGKTGSPYSILFAPQMLIQTTIPGQLSLLMLIEWHEHYGIPVISANTDGIVINCPRHLLATSDALIEEWQRRTGLEMENKDYRALYARDVNNYFAIPSSGKVKRKGEYAKAGLIAKKNPDCEICSDAVSDYLAKGIPIDYTIATCRDIRKFVTMQKVDGGGVKMWGEGPRKNVRVMDMIETLIAKGWSREGRKWRKGDMLTDARSAYHTCFKPQRAEYLGKVIRWYYGTKSPGPILYASNGNTVGMSYGATPCMTLPDALPDDIDYAWYVRKAEAILRDIGLDKT